MNRRLMVVAELLVAAVLACQIPQFTNKGQPVHGTITGLSVKPASGTGKFTLTVEFDHLSDLDSIDCSYQDQNAKGAEKGIGSIRTSRGGRSGPAALDFTETQPGDYEANCVETWQDGTQAKFDSPAKFSVVGKSNLSFDVDKATSDNPALYAKPTHGCWPPGHYDDGTGYLKVSETGVLDGKCTWNKGWHSEGVLTGMWDRKAGTMSFRLETKQVVTAAEGGTSTIDIVFDGKGTPSSDSHVTGSAKWTATCQAQGNGIVCGQPNGKPVMSWSVTGTVPFTMDVSP